MFRPKISLALAAALALTFGAKSASADLFYLDISQLSGSPVLVNPPYGTVTVTGSSTEVTIVYKADTSQITGFHEEGFNYVASGGSTISSITATGDVNGTLPSLGATHMDGTGDFTNAYGRNAAGGSNFDTTVTIDILGSNLTLADFENPSTGGNGGYLFSVGISMTSGGVTSTGWVGNGPAPATPEPSTLAIAGLGALGFIGYGLRRRLKK